MNTREHGHPGWVGSGSDTPRVDSTFVVGESGKFWVNVAVLHNLSNELECRCQRANIHAYVYIRICMYL